MMYNDVDNDLPPFNDTIDGEEIFLFANSKTASTNHVSVTSSFLNEDDDEHFRNQLQLQNNHSSMHHQIHHHNVVAGPSSHLQVDVDELLLNSNFLEQPTCDQSEDPLFWNCKDITDHHDHLNEFLPQSSQLNLSIINNNNNSSNSNLNNGNSNNINCASSTTVTPALTQAVTTVTRSDANDNNNNNSSITLVHQQQAHHHHLLMDQHQQAIIPIQNLQNNQTLAHQLNQPPTHLQQQLPQQIRIQGNQIQTQSQSQQLQAQQVTTLTHAPSQLQTQLDQQSGFTQSIQQQQLLQPEQFQTKWVTLVQTNDQYQTFNNPQPQFFEKIPQQISQAGVVAPIQNSLTGATSTIEQAHVQIDQQQQPPQQRQHSIQISQAQQQQVLQTQISQQQQSAAVLIPPQQITPEQKPKLSVPASNVPSSKKDSTVKPKPKEKQTRLDCPYCKRSFSKNFDLQQHMRCHTGEKPFQCIVCGRGFAQKSNVKKHMQAHKVWPEGPNNPPPSSNHGSARSRNNSASSSIGTPRDDECMQENESMQINDNNNIGNNGISIGLSNDRKHEGNDIFAENRYSCSYCQFNGRTYFELKSHLTIHKREKVFKCIVSSCGKTFSGSDLQGFLDHVTGHKDLIYHCHLCSGQFYTLDEFGEHQKRHSNSQVKRTNQQQTQTQQAPVTVLNQQNSSSLRQQNQQTTPAPLQTHQNQRSLTQQQTHNQQLNNHKNPSLFGSQPPKSNQKYFRCSKCMNRYTTQTALDHHLSISTHNFPCTECNKVFMCERYLRRHLNTHTAVQHVCTFCDKQFKTAAYLKMHSVVHTGEKPFRCNLCEAAFNRRDKLNRHKLTHETVKKFKCPFKPHIGCTKEFNRPDKLKAHVLTHSGIRPHPCDSCSRTFSRLSRLREHKKLHHDDNNNETMKNTKGNDQDDKVDNQSSRVKEIENISSTSGLVAPSVASQN